MLIKVHILSLQDIFLWSTLSRSYLSIISLFDSTLCCFKNCPAFLGYTGVDWQKQQKLENTYKLVIFEYFLFLPPCCCTQIPSVSLTQSEMTFYFTTICISISISQIWFFKWGQKATRACCNMWQVIEICLETYGLNLKLNLLLNKNINSLKTKTNFLIRKSTWLNGYLK